MKHFYFSIQLTYRELFHVLNHDVSCKLVDQMNKFSTTGTNQCGRCNSWKTAFLLFLEKYNHFKHKTDLRSKA